MKQEVRSMTLKKKAQDAGSEEQKSLNRMCINCKHLNKDCKGTTCQTYTGCVKKWQR